MIHCDRSTTYQWDWSLSVILIYLFNTSAKALWYPYDLFVSPSVSEPYTFQRQCTDALSFANHLPLILF